MSHRRSKLSLDLDNNKVQYAYNNFNNTKRYHELFKNDIKIEDNTLTRKTCMFIIINGLVAFAKPSTTCSMKATWGPLSNYEWCTHELVTKVGGQSKSPHHKILLKS
jgi:hypothetical protein